MGLPNASQSWRIPKELWAKMKPSAQLLEAVPLEKRVRANFLHGRSGKSEGVEERAVAKNSEREDGWEWEDEPAVML